MARYRATGDGMWPVGIHWSPGEEREVPDDYPRGDAPDPPPYLVLVDAKPEAKPPKGG